MSNKIKQEDVEQLKNAILVAPFAYGVQSGTMSKEEFNHRREAFEASQWYREPKEELDKLINSEVTSALNETKQAIEAMQTYRLSETSPDKLIELEDAINTIQSLKERYQ